jgi:hypothetical protein
MFTLEMELDLAELYEDNKNPIEDPSRTPSANKRRADGWNNIVEAINSKYPMHKVNAKQVKDKYQKLVVKSREHDRSVYKKVSLF